MTDSLLFAVLGLGAGAVYALLALGLVVTYRASGVVYFAQGAVTMFLGYVYSELCDTGRLVLPIIGVSGRIALSSSGLTPRVAATVVVLYGVVLGGVVYLGIFYWLRRAPTLSRVAASVGVMLALQSLAALKFGTNPRAAESLFPRDAVRLGSVLVPQDRLWTAGTAIVLAVGLWLLYRFSQFGLATRAAAANERGALLAGLRPTRLAVVNWAAATGLAGVAAVLITPITSLDPGTSTALLVPAIGAVIVGRFSSFPATVLTAFAIGIGQAEITKLQSVLPSLPLQGMQSALPFLVIILAMALQGNTFPRRGELEHEPLPSAPTPRRPGRTAIVGIAAGVAALFLLHGAYRGALISSLISALLCLSVVVVTGYVGQISLAQITFAGIGGFALSHIATDWGVPFPVSLLLGAAAAVPIGVLIGLPAVRIRGVNLAMITLGAALAVDQLLFANPSFTGASGSPVPTLRLFDWSLDIRGARVDEFPRPSFGIVVLLVLVATALGVAKLRASAMGQRMLAVRDNEAGATAVGINVARTKLAGFAISSFIAGTAGGLLGYEQHILSNETFALFQSLALIAITYIAGITRISGAMVAGIMLANGGLISYFLDRQINFGQYQLLFAGTALILTTLFEREGITAGFEHRVRSLVRQRLATTRQVLEDDPHSIPAPVDRSLRTFAHVPSDRTLQITDVSVSYGANRILDGVSLNVASGEIVGFIGPNGAGKSTMIDAITGFAAPSSGTTTLGSTPLHRLPPYRRARVGLVRTFQDLQLFEHLTVRANLTPGHSSTAGLRGSLTRAWSHVRHAKGVHQDRHLERLGIANLADRLPKELSNGERKLVAIARALAQDPSILLLDEPAAGLSTHETQALAARLTELASEGLGILLIDHDMTLVGAACDRVYVLDRGRIIAHGTPEIVSADPTVIEAYLGSPAEEPADGAAADANGARITSDGIGRAPAADRGRGATVLGVNGLAVAYGTVLAVHDVNLEVREGEIVALLGANGAGKTTTLCAISNLVPRLDGSMSYAGRDTQRATPADLARRGLVHVPEGRGLFARLTVKETLRLVPGRPSLDWVFSVFPELERLSKRRVALLSGGEQQMLALARALASKPRVLMVDELSLGLGPQVVERLMVALRQVADETGMAVLLVEQHVRLALSYADRAYVMRHGRIALADTAYALAQRGADIASAYLSATEADLNELDCRPSATHV